MNSQEANDTLFNILYEYEYWNYEKNEPYPHEKTLQIVHECIEAGADCAYIHPDHNVPPLILALEQRHHPNLIRLLSQRGNMLNFKHKYYDYIYDMYIGEDYSVCRYNSIINSLLSMYLDTIGESMNDKLVEQYTERKYVIETLHYPLDITDYFYCEDYDEEESYKGSICWDVIDLTTLVDNYMEQTEPSYYFYYNTSAPKYNKSELTNQYNIYNIYLLKEYCNILDINYNYLSLIEEELPDDYKS